MSDPRAIIRDDVLAMSSYAVPSAEGLIKLDAMENPYALPAELTAQLGERLAAAPLNRYPLPTPQRLIDSLRRHMQVPAEAGLLLGNGSDELISLIAMACARPGARILAPIPAFVMYEMSARLANLRFIGVPLADDFALDEAAMLAAIEAEGPAVVYLPYPNNPTGTLFDDAVIERIIRSARNCLVVVDEAYQPFAQRSWLSRVPEFDNLLVMRTVSKLGLAGIRLGYLAGAPHWIAEFDKVRPPYNVNVLTQIAAEFVLEHRAVLDSQARELIAERGRMASALARFEGFKVYPSAGNFLLVRTPDAAAVFQALLAGGVLIKNVSKMHALLAECVRFTVGSPPENDAVLSVLERAFPTR